MIGGLYVLENATGAGVGTVKTINLPTAGRAQFKLSGNSSVALAASVELWLSNDPFAVSSPDAAAWEKFLVSLSGTGQGADISVQQNSLILTGPWMHARGNIGAISGAGASVDLYVVGTDMLGTLDIVRNAEATQTYSTCVISLGNPTAQFRLHGTSGICSASLTLQLSNDITALTSPDSAAWVDLPVSLSGTGVGSGIAIDTQYQPIDGNWTFARVIVTDISGTGAKVDVTVTGV